MFVYFNHGDKQEFAENIDDFEPFVSPDVFAGIRELFNQNKDLAETRIQELENKVEYLEEYILEL